MIIDNDNTIWIDGVPYIRDDSKIPPQITLHPDYHPTIRFRIKRWYWGLQCKKEKFIKKLNNKIYNLFHRIKSGVLDICDNLDNKPKVVLYKKNKGKKVLQSFQDVLMETIKRKECY